MMDGFFFSAFICLFLLSSAQDLKGTFQSLNSFKNVENSQEFLNHFEKIQPKIYKAENNNADERTDTGNEDELILMIEGFNKLFIAKLKVNRDLLSKNYFELNQENGQDVVHRTNIKEKVRCYYRGEIFGTTNSWVAVSTCNGLRGALYDGEELYFIEPDVKTNNNDHYLYKDSDVKHKEFRCGVSDQTDTLFKVVEKITADSSVSNGGENQRIDQLYVEILIVNDHSEYLKMNGDIQAIRRKNLDIINIVNGMYSPANTKISVVGILVWDDRDKIDIYEASPAMLARLTDYRIANLLPQYPNDLTIFFTANVFPGKILGVSNTGAICGDSAVIAIYDHSDEMNYIGHTFAHEIGHSLGMHHDEAVKECTCSMKRCIMSFAANAEYNKWSSCSMNIFQKLHNGEKSCLANVPSSSYN